jgi:PAS domain S-box-containing protein
MDRAFDTRLVIGIGLVVAVLVVNAGLTYENIEEFRENSRVVAQSNQVLDALDQIVSTMKDAETGQRGYLITNQPDYLEPYTTAVAAIHRQTDELKALIANSPRQKAQFPALSTAIGVKLTELEKTITLNKNHQVEEAHMVVLSHAGKEAMDDIRRETAEMRQIERDVLRDREQRAHNSYWQAVVTNLLSAGLGLILVAGFVHLLRRNLLERTRAAADLREQREWFRTTLASIGDAVIATDAAGRVTFVNPVAQTMIGWPGDEALGRPLESVFRIVNETTRLPVDNPASRALKEGTVVGLANHTVLIDRQGIERPIDDSAAPILRNGGPVAGVVLVFRDITERRRVEAERDRQTALIQQRGEELAEADRRKNEFLAMLAHELRNPLAPIRNALCLVQLQGPERAAAEPWQIIERQVEALVRLVDDLLDVSRINGGKIKINKVPVTVAAIVARAVESSQPLIDSRRHRLTVAVTAESMRVDADVIRMAQVVSNLLTNAAKYTPEDGTINLTADRDGAEAVIRVRDTGMGIPPELMPRIFDLFTQAERTLDRSEGGLGIGLTLVRRLTEMHGGSVSASSGGPGQGSEFVVRLPLVPVPESVSVPATGQSGDQPRPVSPARPKRILVVDDNRDSADSLAMLLRLAGHEVRTVHDGRRVPAVVEDERPDLVLLDIGLPGLDGYSVARQLRSKAEFASTMLVALTGYGTEEDRRQSQAAGFDHHLVKPVAFDALERLLNS